jgi:hypothetical protein
MQVPTAINLWMYSGALLRTFCVKPALSGVGNINYWNDYRLQHKDKKKEYDRQYYLQTKDKRRNSKHEYYLRFRDRNQEKMKVSDNRYQPLNKNGYDRLYYSQKSDKRRDTKRVYDRLYRAQNKDKIKESFRAKYILNRENPDAYLPRISEFYSWKSPELVRQYFDSISKQLLINDHNDWYRISRAQIRNIGGMLLFVRIFIIYFSLFQWLIYQAIHCTTSS